MRKSKTDTGVRVIPLIPETSAILHFLKNQKTRSSYVFTIHCEPIKNCHIRHICRRTAKLAGIRHVTPHMLRHTFATRLLEQGASVKAVSRLLGHKDEAFTMRQYISPDDEYYEAQIMLLSQKANAQRNESEVAQQKSVLSA